MSLDQQDRDLLIEIKAKVTSMHEDLLGAPGRQGKIPKIEGPVEQHGSQIAFWRGAIWVLAGLRGILATALVAHISLH